MNRRNPAGMLEVAGQDEHVAERLDLQGAGVAGRDGQHMVGWAELLPPELAPVPEPVLSDRGRGVELEHRGA